MKVSCCIMRRPCCSSASSVQAHGHRAADYAAGYADHIVAMKAGEIVEAGAPEAIVTEAFLSRVFDTEAQVTHVAGRPLVVV